MMSPHCILVSLCFCASTALAQNPTPPFPNDLVNFKPVRAEPVFTGAGKGTWDTKIRERGWILRDRDQYRMWYTGYDGSRTGIRLLGYASSKDGLSWQREPAPLLPDLWVEDMIVLKHEGRYLMFAEGRRDRAQLLTSPDGLKWKREGTLDVRLANGKPIPVGSFGTPTVYFENGTFNLFYERRDAGVWLARSKDLKVWRNVSDEPVLSPGPAQYDKRMIAMNQIVKRDGWYYAYYHGTGSPTRPRKWCAAVAASRDLIHWTKYRRNPLQPVEQNKSSGIIVGSGRELRFYTMHDRVEVHEPVRD